MNIPQRPASPLTRTALILLCLWVAFSVGLILFNRYSNNSDWDGLVDLLLLVFGFPLAVISLGIALWSAGWRASLTALVIFVGGAILVAISNANQGQKTVDISIKQDVEHRAALEAKYGEECAKYKYSGDDGNGYLRLMRYEHCLDTHDQNSQKTP